MMTLHEFLAIRTPKP